MKTASAKTNSLVRHAILTVGVLSGMLIGFPVVAQPMSVTSAIYVERRTETADGVQLSWAEAETVLPGDKLKMTINYKNQSAEIIQNFVITNPVPEAVTAIGITPDQIASVDGGKTYARLDQLKTLGPDGEPVTPTPDQLTHLRWTLPTIPPAGTGEVHFIAVVR